MGTWITDRRIAGAVALIVIGCVVVVYFGMQYVPPPPTYKIYGYVKKTDNTALPGATVTLNGKSTSTDADGYYKFTGLEGHRTYTLKVTKSGYEDNSKNVRLGTADEQVPEITLKAVGT